MVVWFSEAWAIDRLPASFGAFSWIRQDSAPRRLAFARHRMEQRAFAVGAAAGATALLLLSAAAGRPGLQLLAMGGQPDFRVEGESREVCRRFLAVYDRKVVYPDGRVAYFDIVGHPRSYTSCASSSSMADRSVTLVRQFARPGLEAALVFGLACGGCDPRKHRSAQHAAESELSEEARLGAAGGPGCSAKPSGDARGQVVPSVHAFLC